MSILILQFWNISFEGHIKVQNSVEISDFDSKSHLSRISRIRLKKIRIFQLFLN